MKTQQFLEHHGVGANPFAEEDAQTDPVFKEHCIASTYHPTWDKIFGDPADPATSIVFGEKGAGKTALRLQIERRLADFNREHPTGRVFVIQYDDFNPFLDHFRTRIGARKRSDQVLAQWKLWDHMDAILTLGVTHLVDDLLRPRVAIATPADKVVEPSRLNRHQCRDLLLLAACYDQSTSETITGRWNRLRRRLRFRTWRAQLDRLFSWTMFLAAAGTLIGLQKWEWLESPWLYVLALVGFVPWLIRCVRRMKKAFSIARNVRVGRLAPTQLRKLLMHFSSGELAGQPFPDRQRTDDRYGLLEKFQGVLKSLGYPGIVVLVDRLDEPHLINGAVEPMRALLWPMLDNKFLKHAGLGFKLLLPIELGYYVDREDRDFFQRARLDKQNLIPSLEWTGEALYDVARARLLACALPGKTPSLREMFDPAVTDRRMIDAFQTLRVPRHLFKFFYRLLVTHCNAFTDETPSWRISSEHFESALALYLREQDAYDRGLRAG